eukprot:UN24899
MNKTPGQIFMGGLYGEKSYGNGLYKKRSKKLHENKPIYEKMSNQSLVLRWSSDRWVLVDLSKEVREKDTKNSGFMESPSFESESSEDIGYANNDINEKTTEKKEETKKFFELCHYTANVTHPAIRLEQTPWMMDNAEKNDVNEEKISCQEIPENCDGVYLFITVIDENNETVLNDFNVKIPF